MAHKNLFLNVDGYLLLSSEGGYWADGWISGEVVLLCRAVASLRALELQAWNPDWSAVYANNEVSMAINGGAPVTITELAMGESFALRLEVNLEPGMEFAIQINSTAFRGPDPFDMRERSIVITDMPAEKVA